MLRPVVEEVLESSALIQDCAPVEGEMLLLECGFAAVPDDRQQVDLEPLLEALRDPAVDPKKGILDFANAFLIQGDPSRLFSLRPRLRPIVRSRDFVEQAGDDSDLTIDALFDVPGFPDLVAFSVIDDLNAVELLKAPGQDGVGLDSFDEAFELARSNVVWLTDDQVKFRCRLDETARYCSIRLDGFYESSVLVLDGFSDWLRGFVSEPCLIAVPARDEVLIVPLSDEEAVRDLSKRLEKLRPFAVSHAVAYWSGGRGAALEPVESWALRGGLLLKSRTTVKKADGQVLTFDY